MTRFFLLRHGETVWNQQGNRYCGITDIPLNDAGREQARSAGISLMGNGISAIYCSPLQRSLETAKIIGKALALKPVVDDRLYELDFGQWEGVTRHEIESNYRGGWDAWLNDPRIAPAGETGDTGAKAAVRYESFMREKGATHADESVAVIGHNTANRLFIADSLELPLRFYRSFRQHNCGISLMEMHNGEMVWERMNETAHLRKIATEG
ncbi:histidine phosphatase family protein [Paenibacillus sp. YIM B09110]|uniref:histidine phosphatase family protein n=1 Tax=Paenibacillus sp. YIM B09110 TaxID=3126102 RepID=UPI00301CA613